MKIIAWNVGHRVRQKPISDALTAAVSLLAPDTLILNEFVDGPSRLEFKAALARIGLPHLAVSEPAKGHNQVLIASREEHSAGDLSSPSVSPADAPNFLHRCFAELEVVGLRAPFYTNSAQFTEYWAALSSVIRQSVDRRIVFVGDFNANPNQLRRAGGRALASLKAEGWQIPEPDGPWSFISVSGATHSRIDFAVVSPQLIVEQPRYLYRAEDTVLAGAAADGPLSDHAPLELLVRSHASPSAGAEGT